MKKINMELQTIDILNHKIQKLVQTQTIPEEYKLQFTLDSYNNIMLTYDYHYTTFEFSWNLLKQLNIIDTN